MARYEAQHSQGAVLNHFCEETYDATEVDFAMPYYVSVAPSRAIGVAVSIFSCQLVCIADLD